MTRARLAVSLALLLAGTLGLGGPALSRGEEPARLQGALSALVRTARLNPLALEGAARQRGAALREGRVDVVVEADDPDRALAALAAAGAEGVSRHRDLFNAYVPLAQLVALSRSAGVRYVRLPYAPRPAAVVSEGVALIGADGYHRVGLTGAGVKVAVIDLGFQGLTQSFANGELPDDVRQFDYTGTGMGGIAHGTAVAELVHDVAPGADLFFMKVANEVDLGEAVEEALRLGVRVINHSVVWYNTEFGDGRGEVSQVAEQAVQRGVVWTNAAGNNAVHHWRGDYRDVDDDGWTEFDTRGGESLSLHADGGALVEVFLNWDDWPRTGFDYDLYLTFDANGNDRADVGEIQVSSTDPQRGSDPPTERLSMIAPSTGQYLISVAYQGARTPPALELFTAAHTLRTPVRAGSVLAPATARSVLAVGAINRAHWRAGTLQSFSAQGPTSDGRMKPELVGPDEVRTFTSERFAAQFGQGGRFLGTSAAAPHAAGAAALLFEEAPGRTASQVSLKLKREADDVAPSGPDNRAGFGQLRLVLEPTTELELAVSGFELSHEVIERGGTLTASARAHNPHGRPVGMTLTLEVDGVIVAGRELALDPGESETVAFTWSFDATGSHTVAIGALPGRTVEVVEHLDVTGLATRARPDRVLEVTLEGEGIVRLGVELFDLAGRRVLEASGAGARLTAPLVAPDGRPLANGVYLVAVTVEGAVRTLRLPVVKVLVLY